MTSPPDRVFLELIGAENLEIDRVIEVVTVVGNFIRQVRDLRFQRRASFQACGCF